MIKKYKSLDEAAKDLPFFVKQLGKGDIEVDFFEVPFMKIPYPQGIKKFKSLEEANKEREEWILKRSLQISARHLKRKE